jgi:hypothetical protein
LWNESFSSAPRLGRISLGATDMISMFGQERSIPIWITRTIGIVLCLTAIAAGYALIIQSTQINYATLLSVQFGAFVLAILIAVCGVVLGAKLALTDRGKASLPTWALWAGAVLLLLVGVMNAVLVFVDRTLASIDAALFFGFGGAIAAVRLAMLRRRKPKDAADSVVPARPNKRSA